MSGREIVGAEWRGLLSVAVAHCRDMDVAPVWSFGIYYTGGPPGQLGELVGYDSFVRGKKLAVAGARNYGEQEALRQLESDERREVLWSAGGDLADSSDPFERLAYARLYEEFSSQYEELTGRLGDEWLRTSRVVAVERGLGAMLSDEGLLNGRAEGVELEFFIKCGGRYFYYDPLFRRDFRGNILHGVVGTLLTLARDNPGLQFGIGVDHSRVVPKGVTPSPMIELDRWWGPDWGALDVSEPHSAPDDTWLVRTWGGVLSNNEWMALSVHWRMSGEQKHLEVDEVVSPTHTYSFFGDRVAVRTFHAMYDLRADTFCHADGAVKIAVPEDYRRGWSGQKDRYIPQRVRLPKYKVFRFDGPMPPQSVAELCTAWFRENELVLEYFQGRPYREIWAELMGRSRVPEPRLFETPEW